MEAILRPWEAKDVSGFTALWNQVLEDGVAFPGEEPLTESDTLELLQAQSAAWVADVDGEIAGLFIVHPNNIGRCGHVVNASYAVDGRFRGMQLGKRLVAKSLEVARDLGFRGMQFNAVVVGNTVARAIYERQGFQEVGVIPGGFRLKDGSYSDMLILYRPL